MKFTVTLSGTYGYDVQVEAQDRQEAMNIANRCYELPMFVEIDGVEKDTRAIRADRFAAFIDGEAFCYGPDKEEPEREEG